jgi:CheY-like chemotaxis protein
MANILLVDPDEIAQLAMNGMLSRGGHRCVAFASGVAAWEFLERNLKVDLVFMELKLEGGDGLEFLHRLKRHYYFKRIPVVVCTAHRTRENAKAAVA